MEKWFKKIDENSWVLVSNDGIRLYKNKRLVKYCNFGPKPKCFCCNMSNKIVYVMRINQSDNTIILNSLCIETHDLTIEVVLKSPISPTSIDMLWSSHILLLSDQVGGSVYCIDLKHNKKIGEIKINLLNDKVFVVGNNIFRVITNHFDNMALTTDVFCNTYTLKEMVIKLNSTIKMPGNMTRFFTISSKADLYAVISTSLLNNHSVVQVCFEKSNKPFNVMEFDDFIEDICFINKFKLAILFFNNKLAYINVFETFIEGSVTLCTKSGFSCIKSKYFDKETNTVQDEFTVKKMRISYCNDKQIDIINENKVYRWFYENNGNKSMNIISLNDKPFFQINEESFITRKGRIFSTSDN